MKTVINKFKTMMFALLLLGAVCGNMGKLAAQNQEALVRMRKQYEVYKPFFEEAYRFHPDIPRGVLEAVAYTYNHFEPLLYDDTVKEVSNAIPRTYSVMGLTLQGKGVFRENARYIAHLSEIPVGTLIQQDSVAIMAYAIAFSALQQRYHIYGHNIKDYLPILIDLSELPLESPDSIHFALNSSLYAICWAMLHLPVLIPGFHTEVVNMQEIFGNKLCFLEHHSSLNLLVSKQADGADYAQALWVPAAACNYSNGRSLSISNVTIHYTQGTYSGAIAWFQNCAASTSAHYVIRSFDGQVTQMVREQDKAWHVGSANGYTIGIEHEAYGDIASFFTAAMYASSANLVQDICYRRPAISTHHCFYQDTLDDGTVQNVGLHSLGDRTACTQIRGHQHYPSQTHTDPGPYWNWNYYYKLLNPDTPIQRYEDRSGSLTDDGGTNGNYSNDARKLYLIAVDQADSIVLDFNTFSLETNHDFLWIYQGDTPFAPLIGRWNTQSPGHVRVPGNKVLVEFRSDCTGNASGWTAQWQAFPLQTNTTDLVAPTTAILIDESQWVTKDFVAHFSDQDNVQVAQRYYQIMEKRDGRWTATADNGFLCDNFDNANALQDWSRASSWNIENYALVQSDAYAVQCAAMTPLHVEGFESHLYDFYVTFTQSGRFSFWWDCSESTLNNHSLSGYQLEIDKPNNTLTLYRIDEGEVTCIGRQSHIYHTLGQSYLYRVVWDRMTRRIRIFRHAAQLMDVQVGVPVEGWEAAYVGFATDSAAVVVDNLRAYNSRTDSVLITVGAGNGKLITAQAQGTTATCKVKSVVMDTTGNFSSVAEKLLKVDYTPPSMPRNVLLYLRGRIGTNLTDVLCSWDVCTDQQSGVQKYLYQYQSEGGSASCSRVKWLDNGLATRASDVLTLPAGSRTRVKVICRDNAGNESQVAYSRYLLKVASGMAAKAKPNAQGHPVVCEYFTLTGQLILREQRMEIPSSTECLDTPNQLPSGVYVLRIVQDDKVLQTRKCVVP